MSFLTKLFGIDKAKNAISNSANQNRQVASNAYSTAQGLQNPFYSQGTQANELLGNYLGLNGQGEQSNAFQNYQMGPDAQFRMGEGIRAIDNSYAARTGGVPTGGMLKELQRYGTGVATQDYGNYLSRLMAQGAQGQTAANALTNANYQSAGLTSNANTAEGTGLANASLAGGNILQNLIGAGIGFAGNAAGMGWNPFSSGSKNTMSRDPWSGIR